MWAWLSALRGAGCAGDLNFPPAQSVIQEVKLLGCFSVEPCNYQELRTVRRDGGRARLYSEWREDSGASATRPSSDRCAGTSSAEPGGGCIALRSLSSCGLFPGESVLCPAWSLQREVGVTEKTACFWDPWSLHLPWSQWARACVSVHLSLPGK